MSRAALKPYTVQIYNAEALVQDSSPYSYVFNNPVGYTRMVLRVKAATEVGTATLDIKVQAYSLTANEYNDIAGASLAQITSASSTDLTLGVGLTAVANRVVSQPIPCQGKVVFTVGDATTEGFTVTAEIEFLP